MAKQLICKFPVIGNVSIYLRNNDFAAFCQRQLFHYCIEVVEAPGVLNDTLEFHDVNTSKTHVFDQDCRISRTAEIRQNKLCIDHFFRFHRVHYCFHSQDQKTVCAVAVKESGIVKKLKGFIKKEYDRHHSLFYTVILHPLIAMYYLMGGYYVVHGLLATNDHSGVLVYGLDGVGKSTCALELLKRGCTVEADNLVLCNGIDAVGLTLPMRFNVDDVVESHPNFKEIFRDKKLKEFVTSEPKFKAVQLVHAFQLIMTSQPVEIDSIEKYDVSSLIISHGAPETNAINSFCAPFVFLRSRIATSNYRHSIGVIPHTTLGNVKGQIDIAIQKILCTLNTL